MLQMNPLFAHFLDLVMLYEGNVRVQIKGEVKHLSLGELRAGVTNLIGSGPRCHYFVSSRINILDESRCFRADTIFRAVLDHTMIFSGYSLNKNKVFLAGYKMSCRCAEGKRG